MRVIKMFCDIFFYFLVDRKLGENIRSRVHLIVKASNQLKSTNWNSTRHSCEIKTRCCVSRVCACCCRTEKKLFYFSLVVDDRFLLKFQCVNENLFSSNINSFLNFNSNTNAIESSLGLSLWTFEMMWEKNWILHLRTFCTLITLQQQSEKYSNHVQHVIVIKLFCKCVLSHFGSI